ncbi:MAG TPA: VWA domain-containing protein [Pyrinomonadaceae bacterium]
MTSKKLYKTRTAAALCAALCLLAQARAQSAPTTPAPQQQQPTPADAKEGEEVIRVSTELVQTDVMVFDRSGKFVEGLKPEQFELRVDGKPRPVAFFECVRAGDVNEDAQLAAARGGGARGASPGVGAAVPLDRGRTVLFFVDDLHLSASSTLQIRKTLLRFIEEEIGQNDQAGVFTASGQVGFLQQLTDNKAVLRAAVSRVGARPSTARDGQNPPMTEMHAASIERGESGALEYFVDQLIRENPALRRDIAESIVQSRARAIVQQSRSVSTNTLATLASLVRGYAPLPGRKILFFISDGFLVDDGDTSLRDRLRLVSDAAARAGVVIYSLDAQGLRTGQPDASSAVAFDVTGRLSRVEMGEVSATQAPLQMLAADTGGRALVNTNALNRVVADALKETSLYYLLAWRPETAQGGGAPKYQRIEVTVPGRPELRVMVRRGFYNAAPAGEEPRADRKRKDDKKPAADAADAQKSSPAERELLAAIQSPLPRAALPTSLAVGFVNGEKGAPVLTVAIELDRESLTFVDGEKRRADFEVIGAVVDDNGRPVMRFGQKLSVTPNPALPESEQHVVYSFTMPLQSGIYQVRTAARDQRSGRTGSAMQWIVVPELNNQFTMSSLFLGERTAGQRAQAEKPEDLPRTVLLSVGRRFSRTSYVRFLTYVYNAAAAPDSRPDVALQVQLFRDDQPVFTAPLKKIESEGAAAASALPYMAELNLSTFPAGRYVLQVTAIDRAAKATATRRASFVIE